MFQLFDFQFCVCVCGTPNMSRCSNWFFFMDAGLMLHEGNINTEFVYCQLCWHIRHHPSIFQQLFMRIWQFSLSNIYSIHQFNFNLFRFYCIVACFCLYLIDFVAYTCVVWHKTHTLFNKKKKKNNNKEPTTNLTTGSH